MRITVLIDNTPGVNEAMQSEHGLSLHITAGSMQILVDTGLTGKAIDNAEALGIDIREVDVLVLSHGHIDHTGGLRRFLEVNKKAKIWASNKISEYQYASCRGGHIHSLSPDAELINSHRDRFVFIDQDRNICHNIRCVLCKHNLFMRPAGNRYLTVGNMPYEADDEIALCIIDNSRLNIISPCSHSGLLNIIASCYESTGISRANAFVGGLHLLDEEVSADNVPLLAETLHSTYSGLKLITGHCTGALAKETFIRIMKGNCKVMNTGFIIEV